MCANPLIRRLLRPIIWKTLSLEYRDRVYPYTREFSKLSRQRNGVNPGQRRGETGSTQCRGASYTIAQPRSGKFSSDRAIREYCADIWRVEPVPIRLLSRDEVKAGFLQ